MSSKKHFFGKIEETEVNVEARVTALLQFARKAGQLVHGFEACKKEITKDKIKLLLLTLDISDNTKDKVMNLITLTGSKCLVKSFGTQEEFSSALGLPYTGIIGILDNNFAKKILSYL